HGSPLTYNSYRFHCQTGKPPVVREPSAYPPFTFLSAAIRFIMLGTSHGKYLFFSRRGGIHRRAMCDAVQYSLERRWDSARSL
ncbi:MAG: hypothetical protein ACRDIE_10995, partial [Chloroflexota bacterium]